MDPFNDFQKDWKKIKGGAADNSSNHLFNLKNEEIMKSLIQYEKREKRGILFGTIGGAIGILSGLVMGIGLPLYKGIITLTPIMSLGIVMTFGALAIMFFSRLPKVDFQNEVGLSTDEFLETTKAQLLKRKERIFKNVLLYIVVLFAGVGLVFYDITPIGFYAWGGAAAVAGIVAIIFWSRSNDKKINPMIKEIDELMDGMK